MEGGLFRFWTCFISCWQELSLFCWHKLREELAAATADNDVHRLESAVRAFRAGHVQDQDALNKAYTRLYDLHHNGECSLFYSVCLCLFPSADLFLCVGLWDFVCVCVCVCVRVRVVCVCLCVRAFVHVYVYMYVCVWQKERGRE